jgi:hypothetical protein
VWQTELSTVTADNARAHAIAFVFVVASAPKGYPVPVNIRWTVNERYMANRRGLVTDW